MQRAVLADPQTSGGLLVCVDPQHALAFEQSTKDLGLSLKSFGKLVKQNEKLIHIQ
jgi:selenide,water dikinase